MDINLSPISGISLINEDESIRTNVLEGGRIKIIVKKSINIY